MVTFVEPDRTVVSQHDTERNALAPRPILASGPLDCGFPCYVTQDWLDDRIFDRDGWIERELAKVIQFRPARDIVSQGTT